MWKNIVETNIMIGTHADSLIAEAVKKGVTGFDRELAWEAVLKDAIVPPQDDVNTQYEDRQEVRFEPPQVKHISYSISQNVDYEVRAGLGSAYNTQGWVADDLHSESASRTLAYACKTNLHPTLETSRANVLYLLDDDYATYILGKELGKDEDEIESFLRRSKVAPFTLWNDDTGFFEAQNSDGSWAGEDRGWTEGMPI